MSWTNRMNSGWTDERVEFLKKLAADGLSASQIAYELGGVSRNAVIGKLVRINQPLAGAVKHRPLTAEERAARDLERKRKQRAKFVTTPRRRRNYSPLTQYCGDPAMIGQSEADAAIRSGFYATEVVELSEEQRAKAVTFADLQPHHCKWPYGDPRKPDFVFCGCERLYGPYCATHTRIAAPRAANA